MINYEKLELSSDMRYYDNQSLAEEIIKSLYHGGYFTINNYSKKGSKMVALRITNYPCYI